MPKWTPDQERALVEALIRRSEQIDADADRFLFAWGDWCGNDSLMIWRKHGVRSWMGQIVNNKKQKSESTDDAKSLRMREMYPDQLYHGWERVAAGMTPQQRELMKFRYLLRRRHEAVARLLGLTGREYVDELAGIRDEANYYIENTLIA